MRYGTKQDVIEAAQAAGSSAKTFHGAVRYLRALPVTTFGSGRLVDSWSRGPADRRRHLLGVMAAKAERYCARLGLEPRDARNARLASLAADICEAEGLLPLDVAISQAAAAVSAKWPYRQSTSAWAGGHHYVSVLLISHCPCAVGRADKVWSSNGKWSGTDSYAELRVTLGALQHFPQLLGPDGAVILDAQKLGHREYFVVEAAQGRGFRLTTSEFFLIRGVHVKAKNLAAARKRVAKLRAAAAAALMASRVRAKVDRADAEAKAEQLRRTWVTVEDSIRAGNCPKGTDQAKASISRTIGAVGEIGAVRADILIALRDDIYARRAVLAAVGR